MNELEVIEKEPRQRPSMKFDEEKSDEEVSNIFGKSMDKNLYEF